MATLYGTQPMRQKILYEWSPSCQLLGLLYARFVDWHDRLTPLSRVLFKSGMLGALVVTICLLHTTNRHQGAVQALKARVLLLVAMLLTLAGILLSLPLSSSANTLRTRDDDGTIPNIQDPHAVNPQSVCPGYKLASVVETKLGVTADLVLAGDACNVYGNDIEWLSLVVEYQAADRLHVEILPKHIGRNNESWFILPDDLLPKPMAETIDATASDLAFSLSDEPTFSFKVTRKSTGDVLFTTEGTQIVYEDQFIEFGSGMPENYNLYGLGETMHSLRLGNNLTRTLYNADVGDIIDANLYGSHPIYLDTRYFKVSERGNMVYSGRADDKQANYKSFTHGVFQRNAHAQEILLRESNITWRALGGAIDLYFFQGPTQDHVTKSYQKSAIGLPAMQQYWTFGYHHCRWGYQDWAAVQDVVDKFAENEIPLETIWNDIDYMKVYRDFENDPVHYPYDKGAAFLDRLHENNQHYVPIIDAGIYVPIPGNDTDEYAPFSRGLEQNAFITNPDGSLYIGEVWPGYCVWPDWIGALYRGTGANRWWASEVSEYHKKIPFDGIWIDMNEVSSFCTGSCGSSERDYGVVSPRSSFIQPSPNTESTNMADPRDLGTPPYTINNYHGGLAGHTMSPNATHGDGTVQYDLHNLWGYQLLNATYHGLLDVFPKKRPFIIGRSTFAGSGRVAGHWGGDNYSNWPYLYFSIPQALSFSLFGIPMFGVDTCGFAGSTDEELCSRWMQLSAFFPFYRNHNDINAISQEPYIWHSVAEASRRAMAIRYALLPYIYTTFYLSHSAGSTTMRALAWEFPDEPWLASADRQFMLGGALMIIPVLQQGSVTVDGVFPGADSGTVWYDWYNQTAVSSVGPGRNVTIEAPLERIPVYVRGGHIVPMHEPALTTAAVRASPWSVLAALDAAGEATGGLYIDDGESVEPEAATWVDVSTSTPLSPSPQPTNHNHNRQFTVSRSAMTARRSGDYKYELNKLAHVTVLGVKGEVSEVTFDTIELDRRSWEMEINSGILRVNDLDKLTEAGAWVSNWTLKWS
ncbi:glycoside hydrolase family 31 protein [Poronia punctata]|nr:glycoside hydrolase family 31 protein [Poronia punctata]